METVTAFIFLGSKITADGDCSHEIKTCLLLARKAMTYLNSILKSRNITLPTKVCIVKAVVFPVVMYGYELDYKDSWMPKNWCFWTVVLEKTLESPLDYKEIQPVHSKGDQSWIFIGRTDAEAETPIFWPPDAKNWFIRKDSDAGKDWRQEEKGARGNELVGWHHWFNGHEFEQTPGYSEGQGNLGAAVFGVMNSWTWQLSDWTTSIKEYNAKEWNKNMMKNEVYMCRYFVYMHVQPWIMHI